MWLLEGQVGRLMADCQAGQGLDGREVSRGYAPLAALGRASRVMDFAFLHFLQGQVGRSPSGPSLNACWVDPWTWM